MSEAEAPPAAQPPPARPRARTMYRFALGHTVLLITAVLVALPFALSSMTVELTGRQARTLYDFPSGQAVTADSVEAAASAENFVKIAAIDLDEETGSMTLAISGHRICPDECPEVKFTVVSLDDDADVRRALPPSVQLTLQPDDEIFSGTAQLPIRGQPSQYPFDDYLVWLGIAGTVMENGKSVPLTPELIQGRVIITTQNQLRGFLMAPPVEIDPARVRSVIDPYDFLGVQELRFTRPAYLEILSVLLVLLIGISAVIAVTMRQITDLVIGMGSLLLGIWGVRSILVPGDLSVVTSIDLVLSLIILFVLLGLALRAAGLFHRQSELPPLRLRRYQIRESGSRESGLDRATSLGRDE